MSTRQDIIGVQETSAGARQVVGRLLKDADNWLLIILGGMAVVFFVQTWQYRPSAALFPRIISFVVAGLCFFELGSNWLAARTAVAKESETERAAHRGLAWYWVFAGLLVYFFLIAIIGFGLATVLYLLAFPVLVGYRRWVVIAITAILITVLVDISFGRFLHVPLPSGLISTWLGR